MKTFKQHIKEYKGYSGDASGIGTTGASARKLSYPTAIA